MFPVLPEHLSTIRECNSEGTPTELLSQFFQRAAGGSEGIVRPFDLPQKIWPPLHAGSTRRDSRTVSLPDSPSDGLLMIDIPRSSSRKPVSQPQVEPLRDAPMTDIWIVSVVEENPPGGEDLKEEEGYETA